MTRINAGYQINTNPIVLSNEKWSEIEKILGARIDQGARDRMEQILSDYVMENTTYIESPRSVDIIKHLNAIKNHSAQLHETLSDFTSQEGFDDEIDVAARYLRNFHIDGRYVDIYRLESDLYNIIKIIEGINSEISPRKGAENRNFHIINMINKLMLELEGCGVVGKYTDSTLKFLKYMTDVVSPTPHDRKTIESIRNIISKSCGKNSRPKK